MACTDCCQPSQSSIKLIALVVWFNSLQNARQLKSSTLIVMGPQAILFLHAVPCLPSCH